MPLPALLGEAWRHCRRLMGPAARVRRCRRRATARERARVRPGAVAAWRSAPPRVRRHRPVRLPARRTVRAAEVRSFVLRTRLATPATSAVPPGHRRQVRAARARSACRECCPGCSAAHTTDSARRCCCAARRARRRALPAGSDRRSAGPDQTASFARRRHNAGRRRRVPGRSLQARRHAGCRRSHSGQSRRCGFGRPRRSGQVQRLAG